ncbi:MAG: DISARM system phospholipase D-like protein DrmC [Caldilineaceae bacterium]|nr:DISARM system phospholipase D-like protein DrmC [Caldilineaceae bacterium]
MNEQLFAQISKLVSTVPLSLVTQIAHQLDALDGAPTEAVKAALHHRIPQMPLRSEVDRLLTLWHHDGNPRSNATLAFALRAAAQTAEKQRQAEQIALVWTGPAIGGPAMRNTKQALLEVIGSAQQSLLIVSFAVNKIPTIQSALIQAAGRGVRIQICVESAGSNQGKVAYDAVQALSSAVEAHADVYIWPRDRRLQDTQGHYGALHAKCAVADSQLLFLSSANLTEHALSLNMELGVLIRGGLLPRNVALQFTQMIEDKILVRFE